MNAFVQVRLLKYHLCSNTVANMCLCRRRICTIFECLTLIYKATTLAVIGHATDSTA